MCDGMDVFRPDCELGSLLLVLGDGNMTFSLELAKLCPEKKIFATVLEETEEWLAKYGSCVRQTLSQIQSEENPNISAMFGVDGTNPEMLKERFVDLQFSDIIFNFPHHGGKTNLRKSRIFLRQLFRSISSLMMGCSNSTACQLHITLAQGQSGLDQTAIKHQTQFGLERPNHSKDSWIPLEIGAEFGFFAKSVKFFDASMFPGYLSSGYKNGNRRFNNEGSAHTITFLLSPLNYNRCGGTSLLGANFEQFESFSARDCSSLPMPNTPFYHQFRPLYEYDMSFVFKTIHQNGGDDSDGYIGKLEKDLFSLLHKLAGCFLAHVFELVDKRRFAPQGFPNRIYRIHLQGIAVPLCRLSANSMNDELCELIAQKLTELGKNDVEIVTKPSYLMKNKS